MDILNNDNLTAADPTHQSNVPYLDVPATYNEGEVIVAVVSRDKDQAVTTDIISQKEFTFNI